MSDALRAKYRALALPGFGDPWLPDLADPATLGCLLALVREARKQPHLCVVRYRTNVNGPDRDMVPAMWWRCTAPRPEYPFCDGVPIVVSEDDDSTRWAAGESEADALVAALEAAPRWAT